MSKDLMKQRIYIDTSVIGGYFDEEFKEATIKLFERLDNNEVIFIVSDLLDLELINAPQQVREHLLKYPVDKFQRIELTEEAVKLADTYIEEKVVGKTSLEDCRHIALATINKVDVLASWNFKHIVNLDRIKGYNSVNLKLGYSMIEIRSPKDLVNYGND
jgi:predicted nucleic acid-binding protein